MSDPVEVSVVVPMYNERENVRPLVDALHAALDGAADWEVLLVDDGSSDDTFAIVAELANTDPRVRAIGLARNYGQTAAMQAGFDRARKPVIVSMDGDLQNDPRDILRLVDRLRDGYDLVVGYRERRQDRWLTRKVPSWLANRLIRLLTGVPIRDNGCSLKAYRRTMLERLHLYSDFHRFIPALAVAVAGARVAELPVRHHPRRFGESKYGLSRIWKVLADLLTIKTIRSFRERPLMLFATGSLVSTFLFLVFGAAAWLTRSGDSGSSTRHVLVFPGVTLVFLSLAFFLLMVGLVAEVVVRQGRREQGLPLHWRRAR